MQNKFAAETNLNKELNFADWRIWKPEESLIDLESTCKLNVQKMDEAMVLLLKTLMRNKESWNWSLK
jgi:hypothetical protein